MKKFISFVMAAAMVASLVPATAFAAKGDEIKATARVVDAWDENRDFDGDVSGTEVPEAQIRINSVDYLRTNDGTDPVARFTVRLDNAKFKGLTDANLKFTSGSTGSAAVPGTKQYSYRKLSVTEVKDILKDHFDDGITVSDYKSISVITQANVDAWIAGNTPGTAIATGQKTAINDTWVQGLTSYSAPVTPKTAQQNAQAAFEAYVADTTNAPAADQVTAADYAYTNDYTTGGASFGPGWVTANVATGKSVFISLAKVATWGLAHGSAAIKPTINADGGFIATGDSNADAWVNPLYDANDTVTLFEEVVTVIGGAPATGASRSVKVEIEELRDDEVTIKVTGPLEKDDIISVDLRSELKTTSKTATFSVESDDMAISNDGADIVYVQVAQEGLVLSVRKLVDVAEEEVVTLDDRGLTIKTNVGEFKAGDIVLKLSKGFEFADSYKFIDDHDDWRIVTKNDGETVASGATVVAGDDDDELIVRVASDNNIDEIVIYGIDIEATSAKSGATATIRATSKGFTAAAAVEVAKVVDYKVILERDEDEDLPVIYSGVDTDNYGITDDSDHWSVEITAKETFPGAWSFRKGFNFEITEGVYVADIDVVEVDGFLKSKTDAVNVATSVTAEEVGEAFFNAYQNGGHVNFEFDKRVFDDVDAKLNDDKATMTFKLQLVADPGFEGDAIVKLTGDLVDEQELTVAKFVKPYEVKAEQNDMIIDYRYTEVPTAITITEAEAGLWDADKATFNFRIEKENLMSFEDDPTFEVDSKSDLELKNAKVKDGQITFTVKSESDEAATVTIKDIQLFMNRSIPAGPYDLSIRSSLADAYDREVLFAPDGYKIYKSKADADAFRGAVDKDQYPKDNASRPANEKEDCFVGDVADYSDTVKEAFVNVVTAGRDQDDASFTTKVVVPVGENYIVAGEKQVELDTPAYINAAGYTMLPIRAVATALGISNNNVLWDQPTKTVTILYGQRIITMTQGQKVVYVNGSAIPASAAVENTNSRTFLPMRDLATALGVTDITWDQATRTATLNGNQK